MGDVIMYFRFASLAVIHSSIVLTLGAIMGDVIMYFRFASLAVMHSSIAEVFRALVLHISTFQYDPSKRPWCY